MAYIVTRRRYSSAPPSVGALDLSRPIARGLAALIDGRTGFEYVTGTTPSAFGSSPTIADTVGGIGASGWGVFGPLWQYSAPAYFAPPFSIAVLVSGVTAGTFLSYGGASGGHGWCLQVSAGKLQMVYGGVAAYASTYAVPSTPVVVGCSVTASKCRFFGGGIFRQSVSVGTALSSSTQLTIGATYDTTNFGNILNGSFLLGAVWSRAVDDAEQESFSDDPFQMFPRTRRLYFGAAAGGFSGAPGTGSLVKTGQIPTNVLGFHFSPTTGSLVKTGQVPTLTKKFVFSLATGSLVKTGQVPTLTRKFIFTPGTGSLVKTGQIPILTRKFTFTPGTGSIVKTGQQPTLYAPFTPKTGAIVKTGNIPILTISNFGTTLVPHSWFVKAIGVKTKGSVHSQVDSDSGDTP